MRSSTAIVLTAVSLTATTALADHRVGLGYQAGQPIAGDAGGLDHAIALRWERWLEAVDVGVTVQGGYSPGNVDDSLKRLAIVPTVGFRTTDLERVVVRADVGVGWQLAHGRTVLGGVPVSGTEARSVRAELGLSIASDLAARTALRGRVGLALDGIYPRAVNASTQLSPFVELAVIRGL